ncbi:hypothetical protein CTheo_9099 [Ceratobasidium theobromae]|uniref:Uncharacterized protein n=1 Tax=Ceratobasidium theobromae TaxID=1582974 RepID=A0A5N5Q7K7_9AGAM|nr:hypothetical protein CTheo_9099 [Ceratobasidium theobromae]
MWKPIPRVQYRDLESLKDTEPLLYYTGLVEMPATSDPLRILVACALEEFQKDQKDLYKIPEVYRLRIMDEGMGPPRMPFKSLQANQEYPKTWARYLVFLCRLYELEIMNDNRYRVEFTREQRQCLDAARKYYHQEGTRPAADRMLTDIGRWFLSPPDINTFSHLAEDSFRDPTVRFAALINLKPDGSFVTPDIVLHRLAQCKYMIRHHTFWWARFHQKRKSKPVDLYVFIPYLDTCH